MRPASADALAAALTAPELAKATPVRADLRGLFAGLALALLVARYAAPWVSSRRAPARA